MNNVSINKMAEDAQQLVNLTKPTLCPGSKRTIMNAIILFHDEFKFDASKLAILSIVEVFNIKSEEQLMV